MFSWGIVSGDSSCKPCDCTQSCRDWLRSSVTSAHSPGPSTPLPNTHNPPSKSLHLPLSTLPLLFIYFLPPVWFIPTSQHPRLCVGLSRSGNSSSSIHGFRPSFDRQLACLLPLLSLLLCLTLYLSLSLSLSPSWASWQATSGGVGGSQLARALAANTQLLCCPSVLLCH